jgi:OmpA-OmpF porin, OOP family
VNADIPFALAQSGDEVAGSGASTPSGGKLADLRLGLRFALVGTYKDPFSLALAGDVWLPTGSKADLTSDGQVRANPKLVAGGVSGAFVYDFNAGILFRKHQDLGTPEVGTALTFGAAAGVRLADGMFQVGPELYGNTVLPQNDSDSPFLGAHSSPIEAILGAKVRLGDIVIGAGAGPGLSKAPGTPQLRALLSIALVPTITEAPKDRDGDGVNDQVDACPDLKGIPNVDPAKNGCPPPPPPADRDGDGIPDAQDACPEKPGVPNADPAKNGCPADRDGDGIPDAQDACPDVAGEANADPAKNGCPPDRDGDGIPDGVDACPDKAGVKSDDPKKNGCPPDRDGDGISDAEDACPDVPGVADPDPKKNGCPHLATLIGKEIKISEQVHFDTGRSVIKADSDKLLGEVAAIVKEHPEIEKIRIEGHTDSKGSKVANQLLSQQRANAVRDWLVKKGGIDKKRLDAKGFGQTKPIGDNATEAGREANRRVEFHIAKEKSEEPAPATKTAPAPKAAPAPKKK